MKEITKTKDKHSFPVYFIFIPFVFLFISVKAQETKKLKNTVKVNLTTGLLYKNAFQLSYERLIGKNQSLNIFGGYNEFPTDISLNLSNTHLSNSSSKSGYMFGADYRFYLQKENKYSAPHGVYLAPYMSFYQFKGDRTLIYTDSTGTQSTSNLSTTINFFNVGGELGYQFVLGKRFVIDAVVFGPATTHYKFKAKLDGNIPGLDEHEAIQAVIDALTDKLPLLNDLGKEHEVSSSGNEAFWSVGFRYNISIGFRF
jgi:hypothetical protein